MPAFGIYRATVTDTDDPMAQRRIQVTVPGVAAAAQWATACLPCVAEGDTLATPAVGSTVWVAFEAGNAGRPVYLGVLPG